MQFPAWLTLLLVFWLGSITGFMLAIIVVSRMNTDIQKRDNDEH